MHSQYLHHIHPFTNFLCHLPPPTGSTLFSCLKSYKSFLLSSNRFLKIVSLICLFIYFFEKEHGFLQDTLQIEGFASLRDSHTP
jgi:hypothetical protein